MKTSPPLRRLQQAFSLVEMLAVIAIIGIVVFLAVPNLVQIKGDAEDNHAEARVEALNIAMAAYLSANGTSASNSWVGADNAGRYGLVQSHLAFSSTNLTDYVPAGYTFTFPANIMDLESVTYTKNTN
jgi:prepilin-type N-terminal cleavage/methylation domain-containing protein